MQALDEKVIFPFGDRPRRADAIYHAARPPDLQLQHPPHGTGAGNNRFQRLLLRHRARCFFGTFDRTDRYQDSELELKELKIALER